jgi:hypothetical protein
MVRKISVLMIEGPRSEALTIEEPKNEESTMAQKNEVHCC